MRVQDGVASVGIRGGDCEAIKAFIRQKPPRYLCKLTSIILVVGGNNLAKRSGGSQVPRQDAQRVSQELEGLVRFLLTFAPNAHVTTTDLIPRRTNGFFNARARCIAQKIERQNNRHHHVSLLRGFIVISRIKNSEPYVPKDLFFNGSDGVHMNTLGYRAFTAILDWLLQSVRREGDATRITVNEHDITVKMKF